MKALTCEMCGSTNLLKQDGVFVCQSCGTKYSVEEAKKMMVEGTVDVQGTVKVDTSDELKNLYEIARRAKDSDNNENAAKYYDMILIKDPSSWEANFYTVYYSAMSCKIAEISIAADKVANCLKSTFDLVKTNLHGEDYEKAIDDIVTHSENISKMLGNAAISQYRSIDSEVRYQFTSEYMNHVFSAANIMFALGDDLEIIDKETYKELIQNVWRSGIDMLTLGINACSIFDISKSKTNLKNIANTYEQKIASLNPNYIAQTHTTGGCVITLLVMLTGVSSLAACLCFFVGLL